MAEVKKFLQQLLSARYGKDVRQGLHDSILAINTQLEECDASALASANKAATSEANAANSENVASKKAQEISNRIDEANAKISEANESISNANVVLQNAISASDQAVTASNTATSAASSASASASTATQAASDASGYLASVESNAKSASDSATNAKNSEQTATNAATQAKSAEATATAKASECATSATNASQWAADASTAASTATEKATEATYAADSIKDMYNDAKNYCIIEEASGAMLQVNDASDKLLQNLVIYGRTTQDGTPTIDEPIELVTEVEGEMELGIYGRNLFVLEDCETYNNGITFACKDGVITVNGTPTADYAVMLKKAYLTLPKGIYQRVVRENNITLIVRTLNADGTYAYLSSPLELQETTKVEVYVQITQQVGVTFTNATIKPYIMLSEGAWEQGIKQSMTVTLPSLNGIPVDSGGNHTDADGQQWVCDEINFERGVYVQRVEKGVISTFGYKSGMPNNNIYGSYDVRDKIQLIKSEYVKGAIMSTQFSATIWNSIGSDTHIAVRLNGAVGVAFGNDSEITTLELAQQYIAENPIEILYALETPIETPLTDAQIEAYKALHSNKPITTVLNSEAAEMTVKYIADTKTYIDNKFAELSSAIVALKE